MAAPKGLAVPFRFTSSGYPTTSVGEQVLHDSVFTILSTVPGERVMRPTFGSYLKLILFDNINRATAFRAKAEVFRALRQWEPRVFVQEVLFDIADTTITLHVIWRSASTLQAVTSLGFPRTAG